MSDTTSSLDLPTPAPPSSTHSSEDFLVAPAASSSSAQGSGRSISSVEGGEPQNPFATPSHLRTDSYTGSGYFPRTSPQVGARNTGQLSRKSSVNHSRNGSMPVYMRSPSLSFLGAEFVPEKRRPIFKSQLLDDSASVEKPWLQNASKRPGRISYGLFLTGVFCGIAGSAYILYTGYAQIDRSNYCPIMDEDFSSGTLSSTFWQTESSIGGGTGNDFVWYSDDSANSFIADGALNIVPSLTSAATNLQYGIQNTTYLDIGQYCTISTPENCIISSSANSSITVPPVRSASITTRNKVSMKYGRVEITAKMPTGNWLWPRISLVPANDVYGSYPASGLIDIVQSKGNLATKQSDVLNNAVQSGIHWGPEGLPDYDRYWITNAVYRLRRKFFNQQYYTFGVDWTEEKIFIWVKTRNFGMFNINLGSQTFYSRGAFPLVTANGTVIANPWAESQTPMLAPFDQDFFLRLQVSAGGLDNFWSDDLTDKPWKNTQSRSTAMANFVTQADKWHATWPKDNSRGMQVKSVKMWSKC